ncbi:Avirulence protein (Avh) [Phytophthora palmivora]|uniref:RxLR effector protein n=1 Tax=Phytophthora palmivora TaxID=4796 RepID=A0A2P4YVF6_9STRA|nr:Avirulence protein (Avh) [Phytophthora palmivora]
MTMRFYYVFLVAAVAFWVCVDAASEATAEVAATSIYDIRLLRDDNKADEVAEERGLNIKSITNLDKLKKMVGVDNLKKVKNLFKSKITPGTLLSWEKKGVRSESAFTKLKLDKVSSDKLFDNPDFKVWFAYSNVVHKEPEQVMVNFLTTRFDEITLTRMIEKATEVSKTKEMATALQQQQMKTWAGLGMTDDLVFTSLTLNKNLDGLLTNPNFNAWTKFVDNFAEKGKQDASLIDTLRLHFPDKALLSLFKTAQKTKETEAMGLRLENALIAQFRLHKPQIRKPQT